MTAQKRTPVKKETKKEKVVEHTLTSSKIVKDKVELKPHQKPVSNFLRQNDISIILSGAGCAKDFVQMFRAIDGINSKEFSKLVVTKPIVEMGTSIGFLPGDEEKLAPYKRSFYSNLAKIVGADKMGSYKDKVIFEHIGFQRGNTLPEYSVIILSEAQNMTLHELISYTTRVPDTSKLFVNGDLSQSDIGKKSGLNDYLKIMDSISGVGIAVLDPTTHQMRSKLITEINKNYTSFMESKGFGLNLDLEKIKHIIL